MIAPYVPEDVARHYSAEHTDATDVRDMRAWLM